MEKKVLLGMSGGTDSSVAAILLKEAGYEVTGVTFRFYEINDSTEYLEDAKRVAEKLGITHLVYDAREIFNEKIVNYFINEYMAGNTPIPCTLCNNYFKWPLLAKIADERRIPFIATGHYVRKKQISGLWYIISGIDEEKDQSFFLWGLKQDILSRMILPLGDWTKKRVREFAMERGYTKVGTKKDSLGVCFCPMDYRSFLKEKVGKDRIKKGYFYDEKGKIVGKHAGYPFYTIGQRHGLGIHLNRPIYVKEIIPKENKIILGSLQSLEKMELFLKDWNTADETRLFTSESLILKIRYRKQANRCKVIKINHNQLHVILEEPLTAIAAGQAAAFYEKEVVVGGGIII